MGVSAAAGGGGGGLLLQAARETRRVDAARNAAKTVVRLKTFIIKVAIL